MFFVGGLFLLAAALFQFSKKITVKKSDPTFETANKDEDIDWYYCDFSCNFCLYLSRYEDTES
jgi:FHS family L-fucose permease-like MFS transporter